MNSELTTNDGSRLKTRAHGKLMNMKDSPLLRPRKAAAPCLEDFEAGLSLQAIKELRQMQKVSLSVVSKNKNLANDFVKANKSDYKTMVLSPL